MAKPATKPDWTFTNPAQRVEPGAAKKENGWDENERPPKEYMNWLFFNLTEWINYLEEQADLFTSAKQVLVDSSIGTSSFPTFKTLQEAHDEAQVVAGWKILIISNLDLDATVNITKPDIEIEQRPGTRLRKGAGAPATGFTGLQIGATADRVRLTSIAMGSATGAEQFSGAGDEALDIDVGADNVFLNNPIFVAGNTTDLDDNGNTTLTISSPQTGLGA